MLVGTCASAPAEAPQVHDAEKLIIVDCLLPGQLRKLGGKMLYDGPRRPARLAASECEIRGGEYVAADRANYATALKVWLPLAESGDDKAQVYVGEIYEKGLGTGPDYSQAATWYDKAAAKGNKTALLHSAFLYEQGLGVPPDPAKAVNLYRRAAGINNDELTYASNVDKARAEAQEKIDLLTTQLEDKESTAQDLSRALEETRRKLTDKEHAVERLRRDEGELRQQVKKAQATPQTAGNSEELQRLKNALDDKERMLAAQSKDLESLQHASSDQNGALRDRLAEAEKTDSALQKQLGDSQAQAARAHADLSAVQARDQALTDEVAKLREAIKTGESKATTLQATLAGQQKAAGSSDHALGTLQAQLALQQVNLERQQTVAATLDAQRGLLDTEVHRLQGVIDGLHQDKANDGKNELRAVSELRANLAGVQADLLRKNQQQADLAAQLAAASRQLSTDSTTLGTDAAALGARSTEIKRLNDQLADREASVADLRAQLVALESSTKNDHKLLADYKSKIDDLGKLRSAAPALPAGAVSVAEARSKEFGMGQNLALIIGNSAYEHMPRLETAEKDSDDVAAVLADRYGFKGHIKKLHSARREEMITALYDIVRAAGEQDNLIIYYAGHGAIDDASHRSYWLPADASAGNPSVWISDSDITSWVSESKAKHVLIVADSCYAGAMTRGSTARLVSNGSSAAEKKRLLLLAKLPSRTVLTSGGVAPVIDGGPQGHSIFAHEFIDLLSQNDQVLEITSLYAILAERVRTTSLKVGEITGMKISQFPQIAWLQDAGHQTGGEFLFVPTGASARDFRHRPGFLLAKK